MAEEFAGHGPRGMADLLDGYDVRHVNGSQSSVERGDIMRAFAEAPKSMLTNARCLTEGVNIPAVDMVASIDPKQSRVDIAQAVGGPCASHAARPARQSVMSWSRYLRAWTNGIVLRMRCMARILVWWRTRSMHFRSMTAYWSKSSVR